MVLLNIMLAQCTVTWQKDGGALISARVQPRDKPNCNQDFYITFSEIFEYAREVLPCTRETLMRASVAACHPGWNSSRLDRYLSAPSEGRDSKGASELLAIYALATREVAKSS